MPGNFRGLVAVVAGMTTTESWAWNEFGGAQLGDERRTRRAVSLAQAAAELPAGKVAAVFGSDAEREGAFRFVRNSKVSVRALARSSHEANLRRCTEGSVFFVAVDQSSVGLTDCTGQKGFGPVASCDSKRRRGLQAMTALAVSEEGRVMGVCGQRWWRRSDRRSPVWDYDRRPAVERESSLWLDVIDDVESALASTNIPARPWYQLDRGGDYWRVLLEASRRQLLITVRAAYDRAVGSRHHDRLKAAVSSQRRLATFDHYLRPAAAKRAGHSHLRARHLQVRACKLALKLSDRADHKGCHAQFVDYWVVHLRESRPPRGAERLEWFLLTTYPIESAAAALQVCRGYTLRWRVEEFHKTWKSGACNVESSQLRSCDNFQRWATILAAVASRIERLKHVARNNPTASALDIATRDEIDGAITLTKRCKYPLGHNLTAEQFVLLVAKIGGYTGKSSGGPPGSITIGRGLDRVLAAATALAAVRRTPKK